MAIREDIEKGNDSVHEEARVPLLQEQKTMADEEDGHTDQTSSKASLWMVYLSTFVAVCGSFEFGSCVSPPHTPNYLRLEKCPRMRFATNISFKF